MHPAPIFRETDTETLLGRIRSFPLALVCVNGEETPVAAHTPVLANTIGGDVRLRFHLSAHNSVTRRLEDGASVLIVFSGPNAYISPDWYGELPNQVPTWNYTSVEAEGKAAVCDFEETVRFLDDVSECFETQLLPKPPWTRSKMDPASFALMVRGIRAFEVIPHRFEGMSKLSQNKPATAREGVASALSGLPGAQALLEEMTRKRL